MPRTASVAVPSPSSANRRAIRWLSLAFAAIGLALLVETVRRVGWAEVRAGVGSVGWWFGAIVALGGLRFAARARSWVACAGESSFRTGRAFEAALAGDALGNLTPLGLLASEPTKVLLTRRYLSTPQAVSSVAVDNVFYILSVLVMVAAGTLVFLRRAGVPDALRTGADLVLAGVGLALAFAVLVARHRPAVLSWLAATGARLLQRPERTTEFLRDLEARFYGLLEWPAGRLARVVAWQAAFHAAAVVEVYLILVLLPGSAHATIVDAFVLETAGRLITVVFKFVPYRLGVDEAGSALVARMLALDPTAGVTLALIRRLRILSWNAVGLALLARAR